MTEQALNAITQTCMNLSVAGEALSVKLSLASFGFRFLKRVGVQLVGVQPGCVGESDPNYSTRRRSVNGKWVFITYRLRVYWSVVIPSSYTSQDEVSELNILVNRIRCYGKSLGCDVRIKSWADNELDVEFKCKQKLVPLSS